jgi:hypothetical protein
MFFSADPSLPLTRCESHETNASLTAVLQEAIQ